MKALIYLFDLKSIRKDFCKKNFKIKYFFYRHFSDLTEIIGNILLYTNSIIAYRLYFCLQHQFTVRFLLFSIFAPILHHKGEKRVDYSHCRLVLESAKLLRVPVSAVLSTQLE